MKRVDHLTYRDHQFGDGDAGGDGDADNGVGDGNAGVGEQGGVHGIRSLPSANRISNRHRLSQRTSIVTKYIVTKEKCHKL